MPKTHKYLKKNFINLRGINKIGSNTFPNLMAMLTGKSMDQLVHSCNRTMKINRCGIIWDTFRELGYTTAYVEDESNIATFQYSRLGFLEPPTDYYGRPYILGSEGLGTRLIHNMWFCTGPEASGERVMHFAKDFSITFNNTPSFGLFWMNSFSHDDISMPSSMDEKVFEFLSDTNFEMSLKDTIMIFLSDHGFRFGSVRFTHSGWLEARLPFLYLRMPDSFMKSFPKQFKNLMINTRRLTTPYDIYPTLQEVLEMGDAMYKAKNSSGCPNCHSLFKEIAESRTCTQASIERHWCTCKGHHYIDARSSLVTGVIHFVIETVNNYTRGFPQGKLCARYKLGEPKAAGMSERYLNEDNDTVRYFLVMFETYPKAVFEATVESHLNGSYKTLGSITRIDWYKFNSDCVTGDDLKSYCYCDDTILGAVRRFFDDMLRKIGLSGA